MIERNRRILNSQNASYRDVSSLQNWVMGNTCLVRDESAYLASKDLFSIAEHDGAVSRVEDLVEDVMIQLWASIYRVCDISIRVIHKAEKILAVLH